MSTYTTNYNLKKPEGGDAVNIGDINGNMDTVDEQLKTNADGLLQVYTKAQMDAFINTINGKISTGDAARYTKTEADARYSQTSHTHDSRYYTETEVDTKLSGKSDAGHNHDSRYPLIGHTHDDRYYTEAEADSRFAATSHSHDDRYYTETEMDTKLSGKSDKDHTHSRIDSITSVELSGSSYSANSVASCTSTSEWLYGDSSILSDYITKVILSVYTDKWRRYQCKWIQNVGTSLDITIPVAISSSTSVSARVYFTTRE